MNTPLNYPQLPDFNRSIGRLREFARLKYEHGADRVQIEKILGDARTHLETSLEKLLGLQGDTTLAKLEPNPLD